MPVAILYSTAGRRHARRTLRLCPLGKQSRRLTPPRQARQKPTKSRQPPQAIAWLSPVLRPSSCAGDRRRGRCAGERAGMAPISARHCPSPAQNAAPPATNAERLLFAPLHLIGHLAPTPCLERLGPGLKPQGRSRRGVPCDRPAGSGKAAARGQRLHFSSGEAHTEDGPHGRGHIGPRPRAELSAGRPLRWQKHTGGMQGARCRTRYRNRQML
jgi:hypothetical protein